MNHTDPHDRSPALAELLDDAFVVPVGVETAARHLWAIHTEANRLAEESQSDEAPVVEQRQLVGAGAGGGRRSVPRAAVPLLVIVLMMSSSGMALAASQSSLPGDVLYPVKRGTEQAQLIFARSPEARAQLQLSFARARLDEIRQIATTRPQHVPALVAAINVTLTAVDLSAAEAAPDSERIRQEVTAEIAAMQLPPETEQAVDVALSAPGAAPTVTPVPTQTTPVVAPSDVPSESQPATVSPSETPTSPAPTDGASGSPSDAHASGAATATGTGDVPVPAGSATPSPTPSPSPSPSPTPTPTPSDGPIVTARPHGGGEGGSSRSDDGSEEPAQDGSEQPDEGSSTEQTSTPIEPYVRNAEDG